MTRPTSSRGVLADLKDGVPDGICIDADHAVWYADVPNNRCVLVREGGEVLQTVSLACCGEAKKTLYIIPTEWRGMDKIAEVAQKRTGLVLTIEAPAPHAWP